MGGPLINVFLMVYFNDVFRFCFLVFIGIIGWTPDKRISECLFSPVFFLVFQSIIGGEPCWFFIGIIEGTIALEQRYFAQKFIEFPKIP